MFTFFATASAGTEDLLAAELRGLGLRDLRPGRGGVRFKGELVDGLRACLWSRTAMRVLLSLGHFPAPDADALYEGARAIRWKDWVTPKHTIAVDATGTSETLRHTHSTALRVKDAICDVLRDATGARPSVDARDPDVRVVVHLSRGQAELSLDLAGDALFKRGYRLEPTKASLKETLAASCDRFLPELAACAASYAFRFASKRLQELIHRRPPGEWGRDGALACWRESGRATARTYACQYPAREASQTDRKRR